MGLRDYLSVAEDIEWLHEEWWKSASINLKPDAIRRGSTTLRLLLIDHGIERAWWTSGMPGVPVLHGPDLVAWLEREGFPRPNVVRLVAGGARTENVDAASLGWIRVDHPKTGVPALADVGFAMVSTALARSVGSGNKPLGTDAVMEREWRIADYLAAVAVISPERSFTRQQVIQYFAHYAGGAHLDRAAAGSKRRKKPIHDSLHRAADKMRVFGRDGLLFELLSIGQAVGREPCLLELAAKIRASAD